MNPCEHLGKPVPPPAGRDVRKSYYVCDAGHGIVCSCQCSNCPDNTERVTVTPKFLPKTWRQTPPVVAPAPQIVHGDPAILVATNEGRGDLLRDTLAACRVAGIEPTVVMNSPPVKGDYAKSSRDYLTVLREASRAESEYVVVLEDDVTVDRDLREKLASIPLIRRGALPFISLFIPDLIDSPWERRHPEHGYRIARAELLASSRTPWQRHRLWGSQGYVFRKNFLAYLVQHWDTVKGGQDARVLTLAARFGAPFAVTDPCLVEHRPLRSNFATPIAFAPDFGGEWRAAGGGYLHPDGVPGWLTYAEGQLLAATAKGRRVVELGTYRGRSTLALAQTAARVVSVDTADQSEAREHVRRWGLEASFVRADAWTAEPADMIYIDTDHDARSVSRDLENALRCNPTVISCHDYPDPGWPDVRRVVDAWATRNGWRRVAQAGFLGVFSRGESRGEG